MDDLGTELEADKVERKEVREADSEGEEGERGGGVVNISLVEGKRGDSVG